jgi:hypothetical protein
MPALYVPLWRAWGPNIRFKGFETLKSLLSHVGFLSFSLRPAIEEA